MNRHEKLKDWFLRYNRIINVRHSDKQKNHFFNSIIRDIVEVRDDFQVVEVRDGKYVNSKNLYIGNIKKAETVISTYYDTPSSHFGSFSFFDYEKQKQSTIWFNALMSLVLIVIGIIFTLFVTMPIIENHEGLNIWFVLIAAVYILLMYLISYIAKGAPRRKNTVRNNLSILAMLSLIYKIKSKKVAFAFVDNGTTNRLGLKALLDRVGPRTKVYYLDSIGSQHELHNLNQQQVLKNTNGTGMYGNEDSRLSFLISARHDDGTYYLTKKDLNANEFNTNRIDEVVEYFNHKL